MNYTSFAKDLVLKFLQEAFEQSEFYESDDIQVNELEDISNQQSPGADPEDAKLINDFQWSQNQDDTKIFIADSWTENLDRPEPRPALILTRGDVRWSNATIDQAQEQSFGTGARTYTDLLSSDLTVNCFSREGLEAELLANIVFQTVQFFAKIIRSRTRIFEVNSVVLGQEALVQSDSKIDLTVVPVGIGLYWQDRWKLTIPGETVKKVEFNLNSRQVRQSGIACPVRLD
ncbi:hypothetical protein LCGC14_0430730 [marine sediment metagenome]|uniref:Uncharacterized protein n=1 Tax=marine sediment metagenome TaxID=412755 RepID=A0A0F9SN93_9ZZZZ